jgi:Txe/YoeB family toxin of Txe-Axe toxin-antitoxin module
MTMLPTPVSLDPIAVTATPAVSDTPMVAGDDDLIEKEWVEKAKKIVAETRDDPYKREAAVNQLQRDYLMKRYGRELGAA